MDFHLDVSWNVADFALTPYMIIISAGIFPSRNIKNPLEGSRNSVEYILPQGDLRPSVRTLHRRDRDLWVPDSKNGAARSMSYTRVLTSVTCIGEKSVHRSRKISFQAIRARSSGSSCPVFTISVR